MEDADLTKQVKRSFDRYHFTRSVEDLPMKRSRARVLRRSLAIGLTAVAAVTVWALSATPFVGTAAVAFAGWQPIPTTADAALADAAKTTCFPDTSLSAMPLVAQDQRGNAATLVYAGGGELGTCLVVRDANGTIVTASSGLTHLEGSGGQLHVDTVISSPKSDRWPGLRIVVGRVDATAHAVSVSRVDDVAVDATVTAGYFVAWWPTDDDVANVAAKDSAGKTIASVPGLK